MVISTADNGTVLTSVMVVGIDMTETVGVATVVTAGTGVAGSMV